MDAVARIEQALAQALAPGAVPECPPRLAAAVRYAVFPGGARIRPRLCLAVAAACGEDHPGVAESAAVAIELLHCASLVHDDLPCFDDAVLRRGKPSVHLAFDERMAVLVGDALIVLAFETLARGCARAPHRLAALIAAVGRGAGMPAGIAAGQAWECEPSVALTGYQQAKTGALFAAATVAGALAANAAPDAWRALGEQLGEAYQVADDIRDVVGNAQDLGKPTGRDRALGRPSAAKELGIAGATRRLEQLLDGAVDSIPPCPGAVALRALVIEEAQRFLPKELARRAA